MSNESRVTFNLLSDVVAYDLGEYCSWLQTLVTSHRMMPCPFKVLQHVRPAAASAT